VDCHTLKLVVFAVPVLALVPLCFVLSFREAITSSLGSTTELDDFHFNLSLNGCVALRVNTVLLLGLVGFLRRRPIPIVLYLAAFLISLFTYACSAVYVAPFIQVRAKIINPVTNPALDIEPPVKSLAYIVNSGVPLEEYLAYVR
jgi:hypothetical protein